LQKVCQTLCLAALFFFGAQTGHAQDVGVGDRVPDVSVQLQDGRQASSREFERAGQPSVWAFFNTACFDCRRELPVLDKLAREFPDVRFVCVSRAESAESVAAFWREKGLTLPYSAQTDRTVYERFAKRTIPRVYVVDGTGKVRFVGLEKVSKRKLRKALNQLKVN